VEQGLAVTKERTNSGRVVYSPARDPNDRNLVMAPCFQVDRYSLATGNEQVLTRHMPPSSVNIVVALAGRGAVRVQPHEAVEFERGQAVVVPAASNSFAVRAATRLDYLRMCLPQEKTGQPKTSF
jgi:mannose-6-phosphate isomerase-like protein (cupin superfamily)